VDTYRNKKHDEQMQVVVKMMAHVSKPCKPIKHSCHIMAHEGIKLMECPCFTKMQKIFQGNKKLQEKKTC
jgi:hypothetical protein